MKSGRLYAGMRPNRQCLSLPHGRASSIQPSAASMYNLAKAKISSLSVSGLTSANRYAALPAARNEMAVGFEQADMHSNVSISKALISGSSEDANIPFSAAAKTSPFGISSASLRHVEQINKLWLKIVTLSLRFIVSVRQVFPLIQLNQARKKLHHTLMMTLASRPSITCWKTSQSTALFLS